ncbi:MAG: hypothetical protein KME17_21215 [Cyanosarcina radialis HA8281-LM2]|nr:hypothetical protein [Cyanosarcina radialis HA8281-LM2]
MKKAIALNIKPKAIARSIYFDRVVSSTEDRSLQYLNQTILILIQDGG